MDRRRGRGCLHDGAAASLLEKALDDTLVAFCAKWRGPAAGTGISSAPPVVPGWEGNINIKWLRRLHVVDQPSMTRDETSHYTDSLPGGKARIFTFDMEAKSIITRPCGRTETGVEVRDV